MAAGAAVTGGGVGMPSERGGTDWAQLPTAIKGSNRTAKAHAVRRTPGAPAPT